MRVTLAPIHSVFPGGLLFIFQSVGYTPDQGVACLISNIQTNILVYVMNYFFQVDKQIISRHASAVKLPGWKR